MKFFDAFNFFSRPPFQSCCGACCLSNIPTIDKEVKVNWVNYNKSPYKGTEILDLSSKESKETLIKIFRNNCKAHYGFTFLFLTDNQNKFLRKEALKHHFLYLGKGPHAKDPTIDVHGYVRILEKPNVFAKSL